MESVVACPWQVGIGQMGKQKREGVRNSKQPKTAPSREGQEAPEIVKPLTWAVMGPPWTVLKPSWAVLKPSWRRLVDILGPSWKVEVVFRRLEAVLGRLDAVLGRLEAVLGRLGAILGLPWGRLRTS